MKPKVLFVATVDRHFQAFHLPTMAWFKEQGWEVHAAAQGNTELPGADRKFRLPICRSPFRFANVKACRELKRIIREERYELIHGHTPMGGVIARLAAREARKRGAKVAYTAHGFHFYRGAPLINWLLYYPVEKWLAASTDCLVTINGEDYRLAVSRGFRAKRIVKVPGVGVHTGRFKPADEERRRKLRERFAFGPEHFLLVYAAEFNRNKNHRLLLQALAKLKPDVPDARLLLAGEGPLMERCREEAARLGVAHMVRFMGYRSDLDDILPMCDAAVASSLREGLPVNVMEAMACGLPVVAVRNRGHEELVREGANGFLTDPGDADTMAGRLKLLAGAAELRSGMGAESARIVEGFSQSRVQNELKEMYATILSGERHAEDQHYRAYI